MASIKLAKGNTVAVKSTGKTGVVMGLIPIKSGGRGRRPTSVVVSHGMTDELPAHTAEYGLSDLKIVG